MMSETCRAAGATSFANGDKGPVRIRGETPSSDLSALPPSCSILSSRNHERRDAQGHAWVVSISGARGLCEVEGAHQAAGGAVARVGIGRGHERHARQLLDETRDRRLLGGSLEDEALRPKLRAYCQEFGICCSVSWTVPTDRRRPSLPTAERRRPSRRRHRCAGDQGSARNHAANQQRKNAPLALDARRVAFARMGREGAQIERRAWKVPAPLHDVHEAQNRLKMPRSGR